ncbi:MAG: sortase [Chloroflexi bacterium]|nr:sortase [Chloroflexota bacterium]
MASRIQVTHPKNRIFSTALLLVLACALVLPTQAFAKEIPGAVPSLPAFIESIKDDNADTLRGIYVEGQIAFPIVQQPYGSPGYVSPEDSVVTQFSIATEVGNIGLLAHNHLAGATFSQLKQGDTIILVYGDGHTQGFVVDNIQQYKATDPLSPYSHFIDLADEEKLLSALDLFNKVYRGDYHLTLQTCIENEGNLSWGRLFIIAKPISNKNSNNLQ